MSKFVWKYTLDLKDTQEIMLPYHHEILSLQMQNDQITIWVLVNPNDILSGTKFRIIATGQEIEDNMKNEKFIGTVQLVSGLVFHVWVM